MSTWIVKATWQEDDVDVSERWVVNASSAVEAIHTVATHLQFQPNEVDVRRGDALADGENELPVLQPGEVRRLSSR